MSLTTTSKTFRKGIKVLGVFALIYYILILWVIPGTKEFILNAFVDRNPANPKYGKLDALKFQPVTIKNEKPQIVLDSKNGRLPAGLPKKMPVYPFKKPQYSYLAGQNAQKDAEVFGFNTNELVSDLKGQEYQWQSLISGGYLIINTETRSILLSTDLYGKASLYKAGNINYETAKDTMADLLRKLGRFNEAMYQRANMKVALGQLIGTKIFDTTVTAQAQVARVDLYGKIGNYIVYGPDPQKGIIVGVVRGFQGTDLPYNYPIFEGYFWDVDTKTDATYPIISVQEAWKQVVAGKGIISSVKPKNYNHFDTVDPQTVQKMLVRDIYLAYYITPEFQKYMQPIYVFEGSYTSGNSGGGQFYIYYPAVTAEFTNKPVDSPAPQK